MLHAGRVGYSVAASLLMGAFVFLRVGAAAAAPAPNFSICPADDVATGCSVVVVVNPDGTRTLVDNPGGTALGVYDGSDDALIGVQNNSSSPVSSITLSDTQNAIFGFDGDGPCTETTPPTLAPTACNSADPNGYAGPANTYSNISGDTMSGEVDFSPAIPPGGTQWFGLEDTPSSSTLSLTPSIGIIADTGNLPSGVTSSDGYTVTVSNTTAAAVSLTSLAVNLPTGWTYTAGSTTGGITVDPAVTSGPVLTWTGTYTVPADGSFTFHFNISVPSSAMAGSYVARATGNPTSALSPSSATATITIGAAPPTTTTTTKPGVGTSALPVQGLPIALVIVAAFGVLFWRRRRRTAA